MYTSWPHQLIIDHLITMQCFTGKPLVLQYIFYLETWQKLTMAVALPDHYSLRLHRKVCVLFVKGNWL